MDMSCKQVDSKDLIKCTFGLNKTELELFIFLSKSRMCETIGVISKSAGLDRTTVQKSLKRLLEIGVLERKQKNLQNGGYVFFYCVKKKNEVKQRMKEIIDQWHANAISELDSTFAEYYS